MSAIRTPPTATPQATTPQRLTLEEFCGCPFSERRDRTVKLRTYQQAGVSWYWIVEPDELTVEELQLTADGYLLRQVVLRGEAFTPGLFPDLTLDLAALMGAAEKTETESAKT